MASDVLIGVDGGGTRTRVLVLDFEGNEVARGDGRATLVDPERPEEAALLLDAIVRRTLDDAGVARPAAAMWAGLAGAGREATRERLRTALGAISEDLIGRFDIGTDVAAAFHDAFGDAPGIALIAGTGSIVLVQAPGRERFTVGGWGVHLGDEGSGYALAREALRAVLWAHDGRGPATELSVLLAELEMSEPAELIDWVSRASKRDVAALAPRVVEIASAGDPVALWLRDEAVGHLKRMLEAAVDRLGGHRDSVKTVALVGGLVKPGRPLRDQMEAVVHGLGLQVHDGEIVPERGATELARSLLATG